VQDDRATGAVLHVTAHGFQERLAKDAPVLAANVSNHFCVEFIRDTSYNLKPVMVSSLEERRQRFRHLAETHPGLVVASTLVEGVSTNTRAERRIAPLRRNGGRRSDTRSEDPAQLQFALVRAPNAALSRAVNSALATQTSLCHDGRRAMAPKELLPLIQQLKDWRRAHGFSQYEASRVLRDAGIPVTTDSLQAWEIGRWNPRAHVALALAEFFQTQNAH
jgi:DNA-binding XRE family transcriptional regulator